MLKKELPMLKKELRNVLQQSIFFLAFSLLAITGCRNLAYANQQPQFLDNILSMDISGTAARNVTYRDFLYNKVAMQNIVDVIRAKCGNSAQLVSLNFHSDGSIQLHQVNPENNNYLIEYNLDPLSGKWQSPRLLARLSAKKLNISEETHEKQLADKLVELDQIDLLLLPDFIQTMKDKADKYGIKGIDITSVNLRIHSANLSLFDIKATGINGKEKTNINYRVSTNGKELRFHFIKQDQDNPTPL